MFGSLPLPIQVSLSCLIAVFAIRKETLEGLGYKDYFAFLCVGLLFFGFCYFFAWLCVQYFRYNWRKDKLQGKNRLVSVVVDPDKTEHAEYLTFLGPADNEKIRIEVDLEDYHRYPVGSKVIVTYLKFSRKALEITDF